MTAPTEVRALVERYSPEPWDIRRADMKHDPDGDWVRYTTLTALLAEIERLRATLSAITATDCYSRDEVTDMARAALATQESQNAS